MEMEIPFVNCMSIISINPWFSPTFQNRFVKYTIGTNLNKTFFFHVKSIAKCVRWSQSIRKVFHTKNWPIQNVPLSFNKRSSENACLNSRLRLPLFGISCIGNRIHERQNNFDDNNKAHSLLDIIVCEFASTSASSSSYYSSYAVHCAMLVCVSFGWMKIFARFLLYCKNETVLKSYPIRFDPFLLSVFTSGYRP